MSVLRPLSSFEAAAQGVNTKHARASGIQGRSVGGEIEAPAFQLSQLFDYQSYFDNTLLHTALLAQPASQPIVPSTLSTPIQVGGYAIGLHPSSETPVAVTMQTGAQQGASQAYRLKPGDVVRPQGLDNGKPGSFSGFRWGLPFGWLGGGSAMLVVMRTPDAEVFWTESPEIIFHRQRMQIYAAASAPAAANVPLNWPKRFPWPNAVFGSNSIQQKGQPALAPSPTRTAFRLRMDTLAAPADMRVGFVGSNDFGMNSAGTAVLTDVAFTDMTWGSFTQAGVTAPGTYYPTQMVAGQQDRFACDDGGVILVDISAGQTIATQYVDVVRYGRL